MKKPSDPWASTDRQVRVLLNRHKCPVPFHRVRTRFFGLMASPIMSVPPTKMVEDLWGGKLPRLARIDEHELMKALVFGLWNAWQTITTRPHRRSASCGRRPRRRARA
jgi:hypothetical protein